MLIILLSANAVFAAEHWKENPLIFNPSGVPSLTFSQPRFADLDGDGDLDLILGNSSDKPFYMTNAGSTTNPKFTRIEDVFENVSFLDAEVAAFGDLDGDGDLDMVCGGFSGLQLYLNTGHAVAPVFEKVPDFFSGISVSRYPVPDLADVDNDGDLDLLAGLARTVTLRFITTAGLTPQPYFWKALPCSSVTSGSMPIPFSAIRTTTAISISSAAATDTDSIITKITEPQQRRTGSATMRCSAGSGTTPISILR